MRRQSRGFCYTVNNYTDDDIAAAMAMYEDDKTAKYQIIGCEKGDRNDTPHLQCYIYFNDTISKETFERKIIDKFDRNLHSECQAAKHNSEAYVYCMEEQDYYEQGNRPRQGHRTDLEAIKYDLLNGKSKKKISKEYFSQWCQYRRAFDEFTNMHIKYDTKIIPYDLHSRAEMMDIYNIKKDVDFIVYEPYGDGYSPYKILHLSYSGKYRYIFVPAGIWLEDIEDDLTLISDIK